MKGAALFVRCLENAGADSIFGIPGEENMKLTENLVQQQTRI